MGIGDILKRAAGAIPGIADTQRAKADEKRADAEIAHAGNMGKALEIIEQSVPLSQSSVVLPASLTVTAQEASGIRGLIETESHEQTSDGGKDQWRRTEVWQEGSVLRVNGSDDTMTQDADGNRRMSRTRYDLSVPIEQAQAVLPPLLGGQSPVEVPAIASPEALALLPPPGFEASPTGNTVRLVEDDETESRLIVPDVSKDRLV